MVLIRNYAKIYSKINNVILRIREKKVIKAPAELLLEPEAEIIPVKVFKAKRTYFKDTLPVLGSIKGFREADLKFEVSGVLESLNFEEGEMVMEGDIIANLDQRDAFLKLEYAKIELGKNEKLFEIGAIAKPKLEQSRLEYESAENDLEKTNLYAPRQGLLGRKHAEEGEYVSQNDKIATFIDIESVYAEFGIIERDMPKVAVEQEAEVFVDAYPGESYSGIVEQITPLVEGKSRTQTLKVKLDNPASKLKPGMFARGMISTYEEENALIVPTTSLKKRETGFFVYVIHKLEAKEITESGLVPRSLGERGQMGGVEVRDIEIKYMAPDYAEVSKGLQEGELVAVEVREELKDKSKVEIIEVQEAPF